MGVREGEQQTLADVEQELMRATMDLEKAHVCTSEARSVETACPNRVNTLQRQLERMMDAHKKSAPRDTDWGREHSRDV